MTENINIHSAYIDTRIKAIQKRCKGATTVINTSHKDFIADFGTSVYTNLIRSTFTKSYLAKFPCSDCGEKATERCHGIGEERLLLIKRALEKVWPDTSLPIKLKDIHIAFLEEHKYTKFTFKCHNCHKKEKKC